MTGTTMIPARFVGLLVAALYGVSSASMAFVNKAVLTTFHFNYPVFIMACQMAFTIVLLESLRMSGKINLPAFTLDRGRMFLLPSLCYGANSVVALSALSGMNIPMYGVIKRCVPLFILILGGLFLKKRCPSAGVIAAVLALTVGCIIAGYGDLSFDLVAYTYGTASVFTQSLYLILIQQLSQDSDAHLTATETLHLNSYNTLPLLFLLSVVVGESQQAVVALASGGAALIVMFLVVISMGCLLNYLLFLCTTTNCALTTSVVGCLKSIFQTGVGLFTFGGISINVFTVSGISLNLAGGILYTYTKYQESQKKNTGEVKRNQSSVEVTELGQEEHKDIVECYNNSNAVISLSKV